MKTLIITTLTSLLITLSAFAQEASGSWTKKNYAVNGTWKIENQQVQLNQFSTTKAPDLKIFLSPLPVSQLNDKNATQGAKLVAKLKSPKGTQSYALPKGIDLTKYKSIIIHCEKFSKLWGAASL